MGFKSFGVAEKTETLVPPTPTPPLSPRMPAARGGLWVQGFREGGPRAARQVSSGGGVLRFEDRMPVFMFSENAGSCYRGNGPGKSCG